METLPPDPLIEPLYGMLEDWIVNLPEDLRVEDIREDFEDQADVGKVMNILLDIKDGGAPEMEAGIYREIGGSAILRIISRIAGASVESGDMGDIAIGAMAKSFPDTVGKIVERLHDAIGLRLHDVLVRDPVFIRSLAAAARKPNPDIEQIAVQTTNLGR